MAAIIWNINRPGGVLRSRLSLKLTKRHAERLQFCQRIHQMLQRTPEAVDLPDCDHVEFALTRIGHQAVAAEFDSVLEKVLAKNV